MPENFTSTCAPQTGACYANRPQSSSRGCMSVPWLQAAAQSVQTLLAAFFPPPSNVSLQQFQALRAHAKCPTLPGQLKPTTQHIHSLFEHLNDNYSKYCKRKTCFAGIAVYSVQNILLKWNCTACNNIIQVSICFSFHCYQCWTEISEVWNQATVLCKQQMFSTSCDNKKKKYTCK